MTCTPHLQPLQEDEDALAHCNARNTVVAEEAGKAVREGKQAGWGGGPGGVAGSLLGLRASLAR